MTVVVTKGLISRSNSSNPNTSTTPTPVKNPESASTLATAAASTAVNTDAAVTNVRTVARIERIDARIRNLREANALADDINIRLREGEDHDGERAHGRLDPIGASGHLR